MHKKGEKKAIPVPLDIFVEPQENPCNQGKTRITTEKTQTTNKHINLYTTPKDYTFFPYQWLKCRPDGSVILSLECHQLYIYANRK